MLDNVISSGSRGKTLQGRDLTGALCGSQERRIALSLGAQARAAVHRERSTAAIKRSYCDPGCGASPAREGAGLGSGAGRERGAVVRAGAGAGGRAGASTGAGASAAADGTTCVPSFLGSSWRRRAALFSVGWSI